jgi:hypothetical protein
LCGDAQAAAGSCPAASRIGRVQVGAGPGPAPYYITNGRVSLTEGYKGAPYGLSIVVPAVAGPLDLGDVVVRAALNIDPTTAQATVQADPMPRILQGVPLQVRDVRVIVDRPGFIRTPTNCDPLSIATTLGSYQSDTATLATHFQVGDCAALAFKPKLQIKLSGKGQTTDGRHPGLAATLTNAVTPTPANIKAAKVALPLSLALDPFNSQHVCDYDVAKAVHGGAVGCPANTIVGNATAVSPLIDQPITGPVYLVQGIRFGRDGRRIKTLPSLLVPLRGPINIDLRAQSAVDKTNRLVTTFTGVPDAPVSKFTLNIAGGRHGILVVTHHANVCKGSQVATGSLSAQNGKSEALHVKLSAPCKRASRTARRRS